MRWAFASCVPGSGLEVCTCAYESVQAPRGWRNWARYLLSFVMLPGCWHFRSLHAGRLWGGGWRAASWCYGKFIHGVSPFGLCLRSMCVSVCVCFHCLTRWWRTLHHFHTDAIVGQLLGSLSLLCKMACGRCELSLGHVRVEVEAPFVGFPPGPGHGIVCRCARWS